MELAVQTPSDEAHLAYVTQHLVSACGRARRAPNSRSPQR
jgi:hypothetical protein